MFVYDVGDVPQERVKILERKHVEKHLQLYHGARTQANTQDRDS